MKFIFSLGALNKKLYLTILYSLSDIISNLLDYAFKNNDINTYQIVDSIGLGLGTMSAIFIPCIFKFKKANIEKYYSKNFKYISILVTINLIYYGIYSASSLTTETSNVNDPHVESVFTREALEIILITIMTFIILKYKYYIHHILSLVIFCLLSISIDLILNNYEEGIFKKEYYQIILDVLVIICELINFCYLTYLMRIKFYHYWTLTFVLGTIILTLNIFALIIALSFGDPNGERTFLNNLFYYFKEVNPGFIILRILLQFIFKGIGAQLTRMLILDNLSPNHILISYEISKILIVLTNPGLDNRWISLIPIIFQFLSLLFYLEIFEYNFCNLNKNTKKNIELREQIDMMGRESVSSKNSQGIDIGCGYLIHKNDGEERHDDEINELSEIGKDFEEENGNRDE